MEELREMIQILQIILLPLTGIIVLVPGVWLEKKRPVELIPCGNGFAKKIKKGPPWLAIFGLIDFVVITMLFVVFMFVL